MHDSKLTDYQRKLTYCDIIVLSIAGNVISDKEDFFISIDFHLFLGGVGDMTQQGWLSLKLH